MHSLSTSMLFTVATFRISLSCMKMLLKGEVGGLPLNSHGNYIVDLGKSWKNHETVFLNFSGNPVIVPYYIYVAFHFLLYPFLTSNLRYICIRSVFILTTECSALTVTLVVTLRKFMSLIFSIIYFKNEFTLHHWFGAVLVFGGTLMFTETLPFMGKKKAEKKD